MRITDTWPADCCMRCIGCGELVDFYKAKRWERVTPNRVCHAERQCISLAASLGVDVENEGWLMHTDG